MADLTLNVIGNDQGASDTLRAVADNTDKLSKSTKENADAVGLSIVKWQALFEVVKKGGELLIDFLKDSVHAYQEAEKAEKQLHLVAGELTETFKNQATAMQEQLGVSDELVMSLQKTLLRYGEMPIAVDGTTRAILDYAAATGDDAESATQLLIRAVEAGTGYSKQLGIQFEVTGERTKDLAAATDALAKKYAGAAEAQGDTLEGTVNKAKEAFETLQEVVGGLLATFAGSTGAIDTVKASLKDLTTIISNPDVKAVLMMVGSQMVAPLKAIGAATSFAASKLGGAPDLTPDFQENQSGLLPAPSMIGKDALTNAGSRAADDAAKKAADERKKTLNETFKELQKEVESQRKWEDDSRQGALEAQQEWDLKKMKMDHDAVEAEIRFHQEGDKRIAENLEKSRRELMRQDEQWAKAGEQIGAAFVTSMSNTLAELTAGGEMDAGALVGGIIDTIFGVLGAVAGVVTVNPLIGAAVAGGGHILAGAARGALKKRHDGGWIERFHSGGWPMGDDEVPIIAQEGERVLSRAEVGRMGGPGGVERAARGGGAGITVNVSAVDVSGVRGFFENDGGKGFRDALRTNRGMLPSLFGG